LNLVYKDLLFFAEYRVVRKTAVTSALMYLRSHEITANLNKSTQANLINKQKQSLKDCPRYIETNMKTTAICLCYGQKYIRIIFWRHGEYKFSARTSAASDEELAC